MRGGLVAVALLAAVALADGGAVRSSVPVGPLLVTVFTAPTPPRVGALDVSVMVQRRADDAAVLDAEVVVTVLPPGAEPARTATASRDAATNKLLYAALFDLPAPGRWTVEVDVRADGERGGPAFEIEVVPAPAAWVSYWPYLALPLVVVILYALNQWIRPRPR